jgi:eight-cysteine-cluster-containing protein
MTRLFIGFGLAALLIPSCGGTAPGGPGGGPEAPPGAKRTPFVPEGHPLHARLEAPEARNTCAVDADCVKGGCSGEICAGENVVSTCEMPAGGWPVQSASCGCVHGLCLWYTTSGQTLGGGPGAPGAAAHCASVRQQNAACWPSDGDAQCAACYEQCGGPCAILESCPIQFACQGPR